MPKVLAGITISLDGYITGPNDGPGAGLGEGGERLHYWVFGGPWNYDGERGSPSPVDQRYLDEVFSSGGAWIVGSASASPSLSSPTAPTRRSSRATRASSS